MNKVSLLTVLLLLAMGSLFAGTLTVVKPNGGESLPLGRPNCQIQWTVVDVTQNVRVNLVRDGAVVGTIAASLPPGSSPFLWTAGKLADGTMASPGCGYQVRVRAIGSSEVDESDAIFSLVTPTPPPPPPPPPVRALTVVSPNGGESWARGSGKTISWSAANLSGKVQLQLYRHPCCFLGVIAENLPASGTYSWKVGEYPGNTAPYGEYNIRVSYMADPGIADMSDAPFAIRRLREAARAHSTRLRFKPDLVACSEKRVDTPVNVPETFHVYVRNIGRATAEGPFKVRIILATQETRVITVQADLAPGETRWVSDYPVQVPVVVGLAFAVKVDADDEVEESEEGNNIFNGWLQVGIDKPVAFPLECSDGALMPPAE